MDSWQVPIVLAFGVVVYVIGRMHGRSSGLRDLRTAAWFQSEADDALEGAAEAEASGDMAEAHAARRHAKNMRDVADWYREMLREETGR